MYYMFKKHWFLVQYIPLKTVVYTSILFINNWIYIFKGYDLSNAMDENIPY